MLLIFRISIIGMQPTDSILPIECSRSSAFFRSPSILLRPSSAFLPSLPAFFHCLSISVRYPSSFFRSNSASFRSPSYFLRSLSLLSFFFCLSTNSAFFRFPSYFLRSLSAFFHFLCLSMSSFTLFCLHAPHQRDKE